MINEEIRDKEVRVIGADGNQIGVMSSREALKLAEEAELDLVKISPKANPPVCKIVDYGKYRYELTKKEKEAKKKQRVIEIKEIRLSPNVEMNDLKTKANNARKFITKGDKVKVTLRFRGREMAHVASSKHVLDDFAELLSDVAVVEKPAKLEGRNMTMFLAEKR
ncbi:MAG: translation initiation factor IF-3 [Lachnospiraceae bacterium]|jgi:translation initiation factor IF-3|nr:translation initiation factor IF-3 [Lachnospiraceae bacterium]